MEFTPEGLIKGAIDLVTGSALKLGSISFDGYEIPERIPFGGHQQTNVKTLIGGRRIVESVGAVPTNPAWSGRFQGSNAFARAQALDALREAGLPQQLVYGGMTFTVVIKEFLPVYERRYQIPYSIVCEVVSDDTESSSGFLNDTLEDLVGSDVLDSLGLTDLIGDVSLNDAMNTVSAGLSTVGKLTGSRTLTQLGSAVSGAQGIANGLSALADGNVSGAVFGVTASLGKVGISTAKLGGVADAAMSLANSNAVSNLLQRASTNLEP